MKEKLKRRRQTPQKRVNPWHSRHLRIQGELLEKRLLLSGADPAPALDAGYASRPMSFEANLGQADSQVRFLARGTGYELFLTSTQAVLSLAPAGGTTTAAVAPGVLSMELVGADPTAAVTGADALI